MRDTEAKQQRAALGALLKVYGESYHPERCLDPLETAPSSKERRKSCTRRLWVQETVVVNWDFLVAG